MSKIEFRYRDNVLCCPSHVVIEVCGVKARACRYGSTALHAACLMENRDIISLLVKLGADVNAVDAAGHLPRTSFTRVTNRLHPTGKRPHDCFKTPQGQQRHAL
jgi:hypothetical protein